jgi:hypothetical protein
MSSIAEDKTTENSQSVEEKPKQESKERSLTSGKIISLIDKMLDDILSSLDNQKHAEMKQEVDLASKTIKMLSGGGTEHENAIKNVINKFENYYTSNKQAFLRKDLQTLQTSLHLTKKIKIDIVPIMTTLGDASDALWKHLVFIFYTISLYKNINGAELLDMLRRESAPKTKEKKKDNLRDAIIGGSGEDNSEEQKLIGEIADSISPSDVLDNADPAQAMMHLLASGKLTNLMSSLQSSISSGRVRPKKMLSLVQNIIGKLASELKDDEDDEKKSKPS